jgi:hypothetical protein
MNWNACEMKEIEVQYFFVNLRFPLAFLNFFRVSCALFFLSILLQTDSDSPVSNNTKATQKKHIMSNTNAQNKTKPTDDDCSIIVPGNPVVVMNDYFCHRHLGGCGCVFTVKKIITFRDADGDICDSHVICPTCRRKVSVSIDYNGGIRYGKVRDV